MRWRRAENPGLQREENAGEDNEAATTTTTTTTTTVEYYRWYILIDEPLSGELHGLEIGCLTAA